MKAAAAALATMLATGFGAAPVAEAGDRHGKWSDRGHGYHQHGYHHGKGVRHYRHRGHRGIKRSHRYGGHKRIYRGKCRHHWKHDRHHGYHDHGYRHYRPWGHLYTRRHHDYRGSIGLRIDGVTFIWSERLYR